jgi:hypothetical protein
MVIRSICAIGDAQGRRSRCLHLIVHSDPPFGSPAHRARGCALATEVGRIRRVHARGHGWIAADRRVRRGRGCAGM